MKTNYFKAKVKRRVKKIVSSNFIRNRALPTALVILLATQLVSPFFVAHALNNSNNYNPLADKNGDTYTVYSWDDLKSLIEDGQYDGGTLTDRSNLNIIIDGSIAANSEITIAQNQTVTLNASSNGAIIYGKVDSNSSGSVEAYNRFHSMFNVNGGTLNVNDNVTFSGKRAYLNPAGDNCSDDVDFSSSQVDYTSSALIYTDFSDSTVTYDKSKELITENKYNFDNSKFTYTKSTSTDKWDFANSKFTYTPATYSASHDFSDSVVSYKPSSAYSFSYTPGDPGEDCYYKPNYVGDISRTGSGYVRLLADNGNGQNEWFDIKFERGSDGHEVFARGATNFSDDFHVGAYGGGFYLYVSLPRYYYLRYDAKLDHTIGSGLYYKNFKGNNNKYEKGGGSVDDFIWYVDPKDGIYSVHDGKKYFLYLELDNGTGGGGKVTTKIAGESLKPGCTVVPPSSPVLTINNYELLARPGNNTLVLKTNPEVWGNSIEIHKTKEATNPANGQWEVMSDGQASSLEVNGLYFLIAKRPTETTDFYIHGASGSSLTMDSTIKDPQLQFNATRWRYQADGTFKNTKTNQVIYYDGTNLVVSDQAGSVSAQASTLKVDGSAVYKGNIFATSGNSISLMNINNDGSVGNEATEILTYGPYYIKAQDNTYLRYDSTSSASWNALGTQTSNDNDFAWYYDTLTGTLNHGNARIYKDSSGNISVVDSTAQSLSEAPEFSLNNIARQRNRSAKSLFEPVADSSDATNEYIYLHTIEADGSVGPEAGAITAATTESGVFYIKAVKPGNPETLYYLRVNDAEDDAEWSTNFSATDDNFIWSYDPDTDTLSHDHLSLQFTLATQSTPQIIRVVDRTEQVITSYPQFKIEGSAKKQGSGTNLITNATNKTGIFLYVENDSILGAESDNIDSSSPSGNYYVKSIDESSATPVFNYLRVNAAGTAAEWTSAFDESDDAYVWSYDSTTQTLNHGNLRLYKDSAGNISVVDKTEQNILQNAEEPHFKINGTQVYRSPGSDIFATTADANNIIYVYTLTKPQNFWVAGSEPDTLQANTPYYIAANGKDGLYLNAESNTWSTLGNRNNNNENNPFVWYYDTTDQVFYHKNNKIYSDGTSLSIVDSTERSLPVFTINGTTVYRDDSNLFKTAADNNNVVYMYGVNSDGTSSDETNSALTVNNYYYLKANNQFFSAANNGSWANNVLASPANSDFAWKCVDKSGKKVLYNEKNQLYLHYDGTSFKLTKDPIVTIHCATKVYDRWLAKDWQHGKAAFTINDQTPDFSSPRGYFIHATNNSNININGGSFRDLWIADNGDVSNYAPIVVDHSNYVMSSGNIEYNRVGYTADDTKSGMPVNSYDKNNTWYYVGAELLRNNTPNDIPKVTKTAGGIIFTNKSTASIVDDASINNNRGDVGGILVQGDSVVVLGGTYDESTTTVNNSNGGHIDRNIGFHYSGAALVEDGGTLVMAGKDSTMNYNVSWNKGGAVWATEYGTYGDGRGVREPKPFNPDNRWFKKDSSGEYLLDENDQKIPNAGKFFMYNGKVQYNTAFHRGGAINVESDYVVLKGGEISYNNCRALGGAIYVEGDAMNYNYTLHLQQGYLGHNYAVSADPSVQGNPISYHFENAALGHGYLHGKSVAQANDILDRKIRTGNDSSTTGTDISTTAPFEATTANPLSETNISNDTSDSKVWQGYKRGTSWEGNGGGVWLCPLGSTAVFNLHDGHEVYIDDNYATGANATDDKRKGSDIFLMPGNGHVIAKEMSGEVWYNEENNNRVPEFDSTNASSRIYSGPIGFINATTDGNNHVHPTYDADKANSPGVRIADNLSRNGGAIAANGTVLFGAPTDMFRHEAELTLSKRWTINNPIDDRVYFELYYDNGTDTPDKINGYDFVLTGKKTEDAAETEYSINFENDPSTDPVTGETIWNAKFQIPTTFTSTRGNESVSYPMYLLVDPLIPATSISGYDMSNPIDPSTEEGHHRIIEILSKNENHNFEIVPGSWKLILKEYDSNHVLVSDSVFKEPTTLQFHGRVNSINVYGGQGQNLSSTMGYSIRFSVAEFAQEVVNTNDTIEKYINNVVHENFVNFDNVFEYEIMAYVPADADEIIIYDTLQDPLMFVDRSGNAQYVLTNNTDTLNSSFMNQNQANVLISSSNCSPSWVNNFTYEPATEIEGVVDGANYVIKTKSGNYYYRAKDASNWVKSDEQWVKNEYNNYPKSAFSATAALHTYEYNNHKGDGKGTVANNGTVFTDPLSRNNYVMIGNAPADHNNVNMPSANDKNGNTLYVKIDENTGIDKVRGKWVRVSFNASIRPTYRNISKLHESGWKLDNYDKKGDPLPEGKASVVTNLINKLQKYVSRNNSNDYIAKVINQDNRLYAKINSVINNNAESGEYQYYQLNLNGDNEWYRTYYSNGKTYRLNIDEIYDATDETVNGGKDKNNIALDGIYNIQGLFSNRNQFGSVYNNIVKTEDTRAVLTALDTYLAGKNDKVITLKQYDRDNIHIYIAVTQNGDLYQRTRSTGNNVADGVWYETTLVNNKTTLTPLNGTSTSYDSGEHDLNNNPLEGYSAVENTGRWGTAATVQILDLNEIRGITNVEIGYNWPVIQATEPHQGEMNEARYVVGKNGSVYKSNVVTFDVLQPEKYVNKKVHDVLTETSGHQGSFDQMFEYEIMVYVPKGTEEVVIWDTLPDELMFVDTHGRTQYKTFTIGTAENSDFEKLKDIANPEFMVKRDGDLTTGMSLVANKHVTFDRGDWIYINDFDMDEKMNIEYGLISYNYEYYAVKTKDGNYYYKMRGDSHWHKATDSTSPSIANISSEYSSAYSSGYRTPRKLNLPTALSIDKVHMLEYYEDNNHLGDGTGTASKNNGELLNEPIETVVSDTKSYIGIIDKKDINQLYQDTLPDNNKEGNTIYIKIDNNTGIDKVQGKWIKAMFYAQIKPTKYFEIANKLDDTYTTTTDISEAANDTVLYYIYRLEKDTEFKQNAVGYNPKTDTVPENRYTGYYLLENGVKTGSIIRNPVKPADTSLVDGKDYVQMYECDYIFRKDYNYEIPSQVLADENLYKAVYEKAGWDNIIDENNDDIDDNVPGWKVITDDGYVMKGKDVKADGSHAGLANTANYNFKINNKWNSSYTNTVTVVPELRRLQFSKVWVIKEDVQLPSIQEFIDNLNLYWEKTKTETINPDYDWYVDVTTHDLAKGEITELYKHNISVHVDNVFKHSDGTIRYTWSISITDLPRLKDSMKYYLIEDKINGYETPKYINHDDPEAIKHAHDNGVIQNLQEQEEGETQVSVRKDWDTGLKDEEKVSINVQLLADGEPIYERDANGKIILDENNQKIIDPDSKQTLSSDIESNFMYTWIALDRYARDDNGNYIYESVPKKDGVTYYDVIDWDTYEVGVLNIDYEPQIYLDVFGREEVLKDNEGNIVYDNRDPRQPVPHYVRGSDGMPLAKKRKQEVNYTIKLLDDPEGYILSINDEMNINYYETTTYYLVEAYDFEHKTDWTYEEGAVHDGIAKVVSGYHVRLVDGIAQYEEFTSEEIERINSDEEAYYEACVINTSRPDVYYNNYNICYYKSYESYANYRVDMVNTKPSIEKYVNYDVHDEVYYTNPVRYDIVAYVPEEATEIEIFDDLLPTLTLESVLEPNIDTSSNMINSYSEHKIENYTEPFNMNVSVHVSNDHKIFGTAAANKNVLLGKGLFTLGSNSNSFTVKLDNIVHHGAEYVEDEYGDYVKINYSHKKDHHYQHTSEYDQFVNQYEIPDDSFSVDNKKYRKVKEPTYIPDENGEYCLVKQTVNGVDKYSYMLISELASPYTRVGEDSYRQQLHNDQQIGGYYVQISFNAKVNPDKVDALNEFIDNNNSSNTPNGDLNWDVITQTGNTGWDKYIGDMLDAAQLPKEEYIPKDKFTISELQELADILGGSQYLNDKAISNDNYIAVGRADNKGDDQDIFYIYPKIQTSTSTSNKTYQNKWVEVRKGPKYYEPETNEEIILTTGTNTSLVANNNNFWWATIRTNINNGTNILQKNNYNITSAKALANNAIPVEYDMKLNKPYEYVKINNMYYLRDVAREYADEFDENQQVYYKVDWGRGDGDVIRQYPAQYDQDKYEGNHAGIVNTASYRITYGNRYTSTHKSNTVTVYPMIYELPSSGGIGTLWHTIIGTTFISYAGYEMLEKSKKRKGGKTKKEKEVN